MAKSGKWHQNKLSLRNVALCDSTSKKGLRHRENIEKLTQQDRTPNQKDLTGGGSRQDPTNHIVEMVSSRELGFSL